MSRMLEGLGLEVVRNGSEPVLAGADVRIAPGEIVALEGPSGGGKSTCLRALARLLPLAGGTLRVDGEDGSAVSPREWRRRVAYVAQKPALAEGTVADNLLLPFMLAVRAGDDGRPTPDRLRGELDGVGLGGIGLDRDASELSVGQAARTMLLRALLAGPRYLLLDEPDASLDDEAAGMVRGRVGRFAADGGGVLVVRHHRKDDPATRRLRLDGGRVSEVGG